MKKLAVLFTTVLLLASCTQIKIGYVDVEELMKDYDATKDVEASLKADQEEMGKPLDSLIAAFQTKVQSYSQKVNRMSVKTREAKKQELQQEQQQIQQREQQIQQVLNQKSQFEIKKLTKTVDSVVNAYAVTNKFNMILGTQGNGTVMYGDDQINLTEKVLDILNAEYEAK
ncbi:MAG: outer membrane protein [Urechidicola sp.]|jgi:outer membrane protein